MYIPPGFNTVTPYFIVQDAERLIAFLVNGLGGTETLRSVRPDGGISNAQIRLGTSTVMVGESNKEYPPMASTYYFYVDDADAAVARALQHGGELVMEVGDKPYGDRQGGVRDPSGNIWWISQRMVEEPYTV